MDAKLETASDVKPDRVGIPPLLLPFLAVSFLFNAYLSIHDPWALAYVASGYVNLVLFFLCLDRFMKAPKDSKRKTAFWVGVWFLSLTLFLVLAYGPTFAFGDMYPLAVKIFFWSVAGVTISIITFVWLLPGGNCNSEVAVVTETLEP